MPDAAVDHTPNLGAYFARIRYSGTRAPTLETLRAVQLHHVLAIPFENLDVVLDRTIALELGAVERKLVDDRRGGYCFEHNTLLWAVLRALGFHVTTLIARVRWQIPAERGTPRTHMILRVDLDGESWIVDGGFGSIVSSAPLRLVADLEQLTPHEPRRLVRRDDSFLHQVKIGGHWENVYQFTTDPVPAIDYEVANWFTNRNPCSHFRLNLIVGRVRPAGRVLIFNREFTERRNDGTVVKREIASADDLLALLATHFDLHFPAGTRFGNDGAPWPR